MVEPSGIEPLTSSLRIFSGAIPQLSLAFRSVPNTLFLFDL